MLGLNNSHRAVRSQSTKKDDGEQSSVRRKRNEGEMKPCFNLSAAFTAALLLCGCATEAPKKESKVVLNDDETHSYETTSNPRVLTNQLRNVGFDFERAYKPPAPDAWKYLCSLKGKPLWQLPLKDQWRIHQDLERVTSSQWAPFFIADWHPTDPENTFGVVVVEKKFDTKEGGIGVLRFTYFKDDGQPWPMADNEIHCGWHGGVFISAIENMAVKSTKHGDVYVISIKGGWPLPDIGLRQHYAWAGDRIRLIRIEDVEGKIVRNDFTEPDRLVGEIGRTDMFTLWNKRAGSELLMRLTEKDDSPQVSYFELLTTLEWMYAKGPQTAEVEKLVRYAGVLNLYPRLPPNVEVRKLLVDPDGRKMDIAKKLKELSRSRDKWIREAAEMVLKTYEH